MKQYILTFLISSFFICQSQITVDTLVNETFESGVLDNNTFPDLANYNATIDSTGLFDDGRVLVMDAHNNSELRFLFNYSFSSSVTYDSVKVIFFQDGMINSYDQNDKFSFFDNSSSEPATYTSSVGYMDWNIQQVTKTICQNCSTTTFNQYVEIPAKINSFRFNEIYNDVFGFSSNWNKWYDNNGWTDEHQMKIDFCTAIENNFPIENLNTFRMNCYQMTTVPTLQAFESKGMLRGFAIYGYRSDVVTSTNELDITQIKDVVRVFDLQGRLIPKTQVKNQTVILEFSNSQRKVAFVQNLN